MEGGECSSYVQVICCDFREWIMIYFYVSYTLKKKKKLESKQLLKFGKEPRTLIGLVRVNDHTPSVGVKMINISS
jgi:hypothetical protein